MTDAIYFMTGTPDGILNRIDRVSAIKLGGGFFIISGRQILVSQVVGQPNLHRTSFRATVRG
jgi:hypothetical protein